MQASFQSVFQFSKLSVQADGSMCSRLPEYCPYRPGATLSLRLPSSDRLDVEVLTHYTPFTHSQVLHVRCTTPPAHLPESFVLKLLDRRFISRAWYPDLVSQSSF